METLYIPYVSDFEIGFTMGLLVGQGVFTAHQANPALQLRAHRRDLEALEIVRRVLGGRVFGPYAHEGRHAYMYMLRGAELRDALPLLEQHLPDSLRRDQLESWRARFRGYLDRPKPSPALIDRMQRFLSPGQR